MSDETALQAILQLCQQTHNLVLEVSKKQDATDRKLEAHMKDESIDLHTIAMAHKDAFPHGPVVHGSEHTHWSKEREERAAIILAVKKKVAESSVWAILGAIVVSAWFWVKEHLK